MRDALLFAVIALMFFGGARVMGNIGWYFTKKALSAYSAEIPRDLPEMQKGRKQPFQLPSPPSIEKRRVKRNALRKREAR